MISFQFLNTIGCSGIECLAFPSLECTLIMKIYTLVWFYFIFCQNLFTLVCPSGIQYYRKRTILVFLKSITATFYLLKQSNLDKWN